MAELVCDVFFSPLLWFFKDGGMECDSLDCPEFHAGIGSFSSLSEGPG